jgi:hypothetical protein
MADKAERTVSEYAWLCIKRAHVQRSLFGMSGVRREALRHIPGLAGKDWRDVLGSDVLPGAERLRGKSMTGNWRPGPGIRDGASGDPRDMVKAKLPEA